jgi:hypothetical protein
MIPRNRVLKNMYNVVALSFAVISIVFVTKRVAEVKVKQAVPEII